MPDQEVLRRARRTDREIKRLRAKTLEMLAETLALLEVLDRFDIALIAAPEPQARTKVDVRNRTESDG